MAGHRHSGRWTERRGWLFAFLVAAGAHAGVYQQLTHGNPAVIRPDTPPLVTVSLVTAAAPATPAPVPQAVAPVPPPEPVAVKPEPGPVAKARRRPVRQRPSPMPPAEPPQAVPVSASLPQAIASATPPAAGPSVPVEVPVEAPRADATYLRNPPPAYPKRLLKRGIEGSVLVRAQVQDDGRCSRVQLKESSGFRPFDEAALTAVKDWRFVPARQGGQTVVAWVDVPIEFRITRGR